MKKTGMVIMIICTITIMTIIPVRMDSMVIDHRVTRVEKENYFTGREPGRKVIWKTGTSPWGIQFICNA
jgi:hypothetical protein